MVRRQQVTCPRSDSRSPATAPWTLRKDGRQVDCELRFHGESYGWEYQCLHDRELAYGRRFLMKADAMREADWQRERLLQEGWTVPATTPEAATE